MFFKEYVNHNETFHFHPQIELCFVTEGEMEIRVGDNCRRLSEGEMSVALSYEMHFYKTSAESTSRILVIPECFCREFAKFTGDKKVTNPYITDKRAVEKISALADEINKTDNRLKKKGYVYVIFGMLTDHIFSKWGYENHDGISGEVLRFVNENFREDICSGAIADYFGYNTGYISKCFREAFGMGLMEYLNLIRLRNAIMLMLEGKNTVTCCALESGFNSLRTFFRVFGNEFGCTPKEYIKNIL